MTVGHVQHLGHEVQGPLDKGDAHDLGSTTEPSGRRYRLSTIVVRIWPRSMRSISSRLDSRSSGWIEPARPGDPVQLGKSDLRVSSQKASLTRRRAKSGAVMTIPMGE